MRVLALVATAAAGLLAQRLVHGSPLLRLIAMMLTMGLLQGILLPMIERERFWLTELVSVLVQGVALAFFIWALALLSSRFLADVRDVYLVGLVWPVVMYWPSGRGAGP